MIEHMFDQREGQVSLFGTGEVSLDEAFASMRRIDLDDEAWLDYAPMWLSGDEMLFDALAWGCEWRQPVVQMYEREVLTPRLVARVDHQLHPAIPELVDVLSARYQISLHNVSAGWYRDGNDSVAFHGDKIARELPMAMVATVSLGNPRRFLIRPKTGGQSLSFSLGHGDLVVMGGSCQRTWEHGVPKVSHAGPRIALMFRHDYN